MSCIRSIHLKPLAPKFADTICFHLQIILGKSLVGIGIQKVEIRFFEPQEPKVWHITSQNLTQTPSEFQAQCEQIEKWLYAYFQGQPLPDLHFLLSATSTTPFVQEVLHRIERIPLGKTITYKELAAQVKRPRAFRACGHACGQNPIPFFIPCHRVIASSGALQGYMGHFPNGLVIKKQLLDIERQIANSKTQK